MSLLSLSGVLAVGSLVVLSSGCEGGKPGVDRPASVTVFAAASTKEAMEEIGKLFRERTGIEVKVSPGASNTLAAQISEGAPADLFLSASVEWADSLKAKGLVRESRNLLGNLLVVAVPRGNPAAINDPADLLTARVKKVALAGENVPAGKYAEQALRALSLYQPLLDQKKIVRGQDVRMALGYVERGEVEAGVVYATDARISKEVTTACSFDSKLHDPIVYPWVLLQAGDRSESAKKLYGWVAGPEGRAVFEKNGFTVRD